MSYEKECLYRLKTNHNLSDLNKKIELFENAGRTNIKINGKDHTINEFNNIYLDSDIDNNYISLKPDNNTSQLTLSDGIDKNISIKYDSITLNNGILNSSTITLDNNNLQITSTDNIEIACNSVGIGGTISFNGGSALIANSAGAATGTFLVLTINGIPYKLPLFNINI
jgi:hypothetical protein